MYEMSENDTVTIPMNALLRYGGTSIISILVGIGGFQAVAPAAAQVAELTTQIALLQQSVTSLQMSVNGLQQGLGEYASKEWVRQEMSRYHRSNPLSP